MFLKSTILSVFLSNTALLLMFWSGDRVFFYEVKLCGVF